MAFVESWVETDPDGSVITVSLLDDAQRLTKRALRERLEGDPAVLGSGVFDAGTFGTTAMVKKGVARAFTVTNADLTTTYLQDGRLAVNLDDNTLYHSRASGLVRMKVRAEEIISGAPPIFTSLTVTPGTSSLQAVTATTVVATGLITASLGVQIDGGGYLAGKIYYSASQGLSLAARTASANDFVVVKADGASNVIAIPTGTANVVFGNQITVGDGSAAAPGWRLTSVQSGFYYIGGGSVGYAHSGVLNITYTAALTTFVSALQGMNFIAVNPLQNNQASATVITHNGASTGAIYAFGANAATQANLQLISRSSNGSLVTTLVDFGPTTATFGSLAFSGITTLTITGTASLQGVTLTTATATGTVTYSGSSYADFTGTSTSGLSVWVRQIQNTSISYGINSQPVFTTGVVTGKALYAQVTTAAAAFTLTDGYGLHIDVPVKGAGSTLTNITGIRVESQVLAGATAYGVRIINADAGKALYIDAGGMTVVAGTSAFQAVTVTTMTATGDSFVGATAESGWTGRATMKSSADGVIELFNDALTGFTRLNFGGTTASFPSLSRNNAELVAKLADNSTDAGFVAKYITTSGNSSGTGAAIWIQGTGTAVANTIYGIRIEPTWGTDATSHGTALRVLPSLTGVFTMTTLDGILIESQSIGGGAAATTGYGLRILAQSSAVTNWAIYCASSATSGGVTFRDTALATTATKGHMWIPTTAGAPTGVPSPIPTGQVAMQYDTTNNFLYIYNGGWKKSTVYA